MKLFYSKTSPYARKVRMVILNNRLEENIEAVEVNPFGDVSELTKYNPLGKIPTLVLDDGEALCDSPLICHYLNNLNDQRMLSDNSEQYWDILRWQALADGLMDAAYNLVMERRREQEEQSSSCKAQWTLEITRVLEQIDVEFNVDDKVIKLSQISVASALGYLELRLPELLHETQYAKIIKWYNAFKTQDIMLATQPQE